MARVYLQSALKWVLAFSLIIGTPIGGHEIWLYFAYSVEKGHITITNYTEKTYCDSTEWGQRTPCCTYVDYDVNEDTFWYPMGYDPWGRSIAFETDTAVKDWRFQRSWGKSWRTIDLSKPCFYKWCGAKTNNAFLNRYTVAWREGRSYKTRVCAIKYNSTDYINWGMRIFNATWLGKYIEIEEDQYVVQPDNKAIKFAPDFGCSNDNPFVRCDSNVDGNGDGEIGTGESRYVIDIRDWSIVDKRLDTGNVGEIVIE